MHYPLDPISATFEQGVFRPKAPIELPNGCQVQLSIISAESPSTQSLPGTEGQQSIEEQLHRLSEGAPAEIWKQLPADLSDRIDHYVYGIQ